MVSVGGLDPSGGAGLARDFATATDLGAAAVLVGTAWTTQSKRGVRGFEPRAPKAVRDAILRALDEAPRGYTCVKVGMVATPAIAKAVVEALANFGGPVVFDPVLGASSGGKLFSGKPNELFALVERATVTTPNLDEAAALLGLRGVRTLEDAGRAARAMRALGANAVLIKGGHLPGEAVDLLAWPKGERVFRAARVPGPSPRGTGCALATALAIELGRGRDLQVAVRVAKAWLLGRIRAAGPVGGEIHLGAARTKRS